MCWDQHQQTSFPLKYFLFISINHEISAVIHLDESLLTNKQAASDRLTANCGTIGITCTLQPYAAGYNLCWMCTLTEIYSILTWSVVYIPQDFPLFIIIFLTISITASHGSTITSARCDWFQIGPNNGRYIERAPGWDTAATQAPVSSPRRCNCSHQKCGPGRIFQNSTWDRM